MVYLKGLNTTWLCSLCGLVYLYALLEFPIHDMADNKLSHRLCVLSSSCKRGAAMIVMLNECGVLAQQFSMCCRLGSHQRCYQKRSRRCIAVSA
jgi:hypothetical protein